MRLAIKNQRILKTKINEENLDEVTYKYFHDWYKSIINKKYERAKKLCINFIKFCKTTIKLSSWGELNINYNKVLISAILFRGLQEFVYIKERTKNKKWNKSNKEVEYNWIILQDCKDRLDFAYQYLTETEIIDNVLNEIQLIDKLFKVSFGIGKYISPEILIKKSVCNICNEDVRSCNHISGRIYNGKVCYGLPVDPSIRAVSLVDVPRDLRCRIWGWQIEGTMLKDVCIMTSFAVDDFLNQDEYQKVGIFCSFVINDNEIFSEYEFINGVNNQHYQANP
ncbi:hypothetical protein IQ277_24195 [Nostocales cyanobacterium LEGE 12452]|nr:hypothetical protein [Nostocales cyanobacterium LEGE 12452]